MDQNELNLTLIIWILLPLMRSLGSNLKLKEVVKNRCLSYYALKLKEVEPQRPPLVGRR